MSTGIISDIGTVRTISALEWIISGGLCEELRVGPDGGTIE